MFSSTAVWGNENALKASVYLETVSTEDSDTQYILKGFFVDLITSLNDVSDTLQISLNEKPNKDVSDIIVSAALDLTNSEFFSERPEIIVLKSKPLLSDRADKDANTLYLIIGPEEDRLEALLTDAFATIDKSGIYSDIFDRWKAVYQQSIDSKSRKKILLTVLIMIVILSSVLITWSWILGKRVDEQSNHQSQ